MDWQKTVELELGQLIVTGVLIIALGMVGAAYLRASARTGPARKRLAGTGPWDWIRRHYWKLMLGAGLGAGALAAGLYLLEIGYSVTGIVDRLREAAWNGGTPEDLRNLATATGILLTALAAALTLIFQLVKVWITERQTMTAEQGFVTDQITKAVAGLGAEKTVKGDGITKAVAGQGAEKTVKGDGITEYTTANIEVRIGAIYALERIAQDSPRDHVQIMEILCAYIRQNSHAIPAADFTDEDGTPMPEWEPLKDGATEAERKAHIAAQQNRFGGAGFFSMAWRWAQGLKARTDIQAAMQVLGRRSAAQQAIEQRDTRYGAAGYRLDLRESNLQAVDISGLDLSRALLSKARMEGANLNGARMAGADLSGARMEGADLREAQMAGADLREVRMDDRTSLGRAKLRGAALKDADYASVSWSQDQIDQVFGDASVILPDAITRPDHWPGWALGRASYDEWVKWRANPDAYTPPPKPVT